MKTVGLSKKIYCPIYTCFKEYKTPAALIQHIEQSHAYLESNGLTMDQTGNLKISNKHLNKLIMICKMLPDFMKKDVFV